MSGLDEELFFAVFNSKTEDYALENLVEKEKKYYWKTKACDEQKEKYNLVHNGFGAVIVVADSEMMINDSSAELTESEIKEWGYNPEMFDKEEVE